MQNQLEETSQYKLPIEKYRAQILKHIQEQSVVIISGLTGCGKSTQVPQYIFQTYPDCKIAVCQPRRLAATSLSLRVCQQRNTKIGHKIGYKIGLQAKKSQQTQLTYMTYGILIQELLFKQQLPYDFIILDEVHQRSLEMDFAFVILKKMINKMIKKQTKNKKHITHEIIKDQQQKTTNSQKKQKKDDFNQGPNKLQPQIKGQQKLQSKKKSTPTVNIASKRLKLIVMSATLNSELFQKYFAVHNLTNLLIQPQVKVLQVVSEQLQGNKKRRGTRQTQIRRGNVLQNTNNDASLRQVSISYPNLEQYRQGKCIFINQKSRYSIKQIYLQEFLPYFQLKCPQRNYQNQDEIRLQQRHYQWGLKLIDKVFRQIQYDDKYNNQNNENIQSAGDILVFLPGLIQINKMKHQLVLKNQRFRQKIVQVHSLFSQELYNKLFKSKVKNKIILATNIGQSSITLPNCKVVIDYCLNRKAVKNTNQGISRFSTNVASLSNLIQRKGRVGRVSDGTVYRMITRKQLQQLQHFDIPQIKCVNLQMTILKTKKLQSTFNCSIFQDLYEIFLNVLDPPQLSAIQSAIYNLIHEEALQYITETQNELSLNQNQNIFKQKSQRKSESINQNLKNTGSIQTNTQKQSKLKNQYKNCNLNQSQQDWDQQIKNDLKTKQQKKSVSQGKNITEKYNSGKKYIGKYLKITKVGQFMVSMPCDLGISKLILMGVKLGIASTIIDIATIIMSTKAFFTHQQKRYNIEEFMHSMIGYDQGQNNDYLLRQRLFDHWRNRFYIPFRQKHCKNNQLNQNQKLPNPQTSFRIFDFGEEIQFDQNYRTVQKFINKNISPDQLEFCKNRGVFANHMRQLLRISQTLKIRLQVIGIQKSKLNMFKPSVQLVLICLMYAFPDVICEVQFDTKRKQLYKQIQSSEYFHNKIHVPHTQYINQKQLSRYLQPQRNYQFIKKQNIWTIWSYDSILKKFLLPKNYTKSNTEYCSSFYRHCKQSKIKYFIDYSVYQGYRNITVLNQSINKEILLPKNHFGSNIVQKQYMISHNLIQSKGRYMIGANALIPSFQLVIISMIVKKNIKVRLHYSKQFFSHIKINQKSFQIPLLMTENQLSLIIKLRQLSKRRKQQDIASYKEQFDKKQLEILQNIFKLQNKRSAEQDWQQLFIEQQIKVHENKNSSDTNLKPINLYQSALQNRSANNHQIREKWIPIQQAQHIMKKENQKKKNKIKPFYQRYNEWKKYILSASERQYRLLTTIQPILVCGHCYRNEKFVQIDLIHSFDYGKKLLKLNQYSSSWKYDQDNHSKKNNSNSKENGSKIGTKLYCKKDHYIANIIDEDYAQIDLQNVYIYVPYNRVFAISQIKNKAQYDQILTTVKYEGQQQLKREQQKFEEYQCKICFNKQSYHKMFIRSQIYVKKDKKKNGIKDPLWNVIVDHFVSNNHLQRRQAFKNSIKF